MGIIEKVFKLEGPSGFEKAEYALLDTEGGELITRKTPYQGDSYVSLKDVTYAVINGILYVKGTRISYHSVSGVWGNYHLGSSSPWDKRYEIKEEFLEKYEVPEANILRNVSKGPRFKLLRTTYKLVFDTGINNHGKIVKVKAESPFTFCLHPFKIRE